MTKIDSVKERVAYLKVWLGIFVVTIISLIGWLVANYATAKLLLVVFDIVAILILAAAILLTHREINRRIDELENL
jgi:undecaprenyl pyrophosphate phosphatase UppP